MSDRGEPQACEVDHPLFAWLWARLAPRAEPAIAPHRQRLVAGLRGRVVEVGVGTGASFAHYPGEVVEITAVEPEPRLRSSAEAAAASASAPVDVVAGVASSLPVEDGWADAVVVSLVLCSVPDQSAALREFRRVLAPHGELRFLEHVRAATPALSRVQRALDATVWPRVGGGCHSHRDTVRAIERSGFALTAVDRFDFPDLPGPLRGPTSPHVLGTARPA
jgi:ubiquinone/menaquinone biosynthesis C-methylase UbiE